MLNTSIFPETFRSLLTIIQTEMTKPKSTYYSRIIESERDRVNRIAMDRCALDMERRQICNQAARILRKLGFHDAVAEQADTGRRDVRATFLGHQFIVGVFWDGSIKVLPPMSQYHGTGWVYVYRDLSNLPAVVKFVLSEALLNGLSPAERAKFEPSSHFLRNVPGLADYNIA